MMKTFFLTLFIMSFPVLMNACEIFMIVEGAKKDVYKTGDVVVIKITVRLEHRNCNVDLNETAITVSGSQITGATKWVNTEGRTWERKIKIKITADTENKTTITTERKCDRDGGKSSLTLMTSS